MKNNFTLIFFTVVAFSILTLPSCKKNHDDTPDLHARLRAHKWLWVGLKQGSTDIPLQGCATDNEEVFTDDNNGYDDFGQYRCNPNETTRYFTYTVNNQSTFTSIGPNGTLVCQNVVCTDYSFEYDFVDPTDGLTYRITFTAI